jgi:hypothetical protein
MTLMQVALKTPGGIKMKSNSIWTLSGCALAILCFGAVAEAPQKGDTKNQTSEKVASAPDPTSLKQYIDAHRGL